MAQRRITSGCLFRYAASAQETYAGRPGRLDRAPARLFGSTIREFLLGGSREVTVTNPQTNQWTDQLGALIAELSPDEVWQLGEICNENSRRCSGTAIERYSLRPSSTDGWILAKGEDFHADSLAPLVNKNKRVLEAFVLVTRAELYRSPLGKDDGPLISQWAAEKDERTKRMTSAEISLVHQADLGLGNPVITGIPDPNLFALQYTAANEAAITFIGTKMKYWERLTPGVAEYFLCTLRLCQVPEFLLANDD